MAEKGFGTKQQREVPASMAEQLDAVDTFTPSTIDDIGDKEMVFNPETRGVMQGKDLKKKLGDAKKAEEKAGPDSQKTMEKIVGDTKDQSKTTTGEVVPDAVQEADEQSAAAKKETEDNLKAKTEASARETAKAKRG